MLAIAKKALAVWKPSETKTLRKNVFVFEASPTHHSGSENEFCHARVPSKNMWTYYREQQRRKGRKTIHFSAKQKCSSTCSSIVSGCGFLSQFPQNSPTTLHVTLMALYHEKKLLQFSVMFTIFGAMFGEMFVFNIITPCAILFYALRDHSS